MVVKGHQGQVLQMRLVFERADSESAVALYCDVLGLRGLRRSKVAAMPGRRSLDAGTATLDIENPVQVAMIDEVAVAGR